MQKRGGMRKRKIDPARAFPVIRRNRAVSHDIKQKRVALSKRLVLILFLLTFLLIYGGFHLHFFCRIRSAFGMSGGPGVVLASFLLVGLIAPFIVRFAEEQECYFWARLMSITGFYWMAFLMLFCSVSLFVEIYNLIAAAFATHRHAGIFIPTAVVRFMIPAIASMILVIYGSFEARGLQTEFLVVHSPKIPKEIKRIRVLQISDVHIGGAAEDGHVAKIVRAARSLAPDVIVSTGDLVDGRGPYVSEAASRFREVRPKWGKYAITGNHEFYLGVDEAMDFMRDAGFILLRNEGVTVGGLLDLVGADDPGGIANSPKQPFSEKDLLSGTERDHFKILLKHRPVVDKNAIGFFDLQLSGHTHKGQIFPFCLFTKIAFPYHAGDYRLPDGSLLHVSRGAGVWGPPIRVLAPPEITVIDLVPGKNGSDGS